jgi:hypothetical protein
MAKTFRTVGSGSAQTTEPIENNKIPIYDTKTDAESDLANLTVGQIIATKDEGNETSTPVDVVEDGNMHAVTSNAVADSLSYSTDETLTGGKWIDGKPIYRKVYYRSETNPFQYNNIILESGFANTKNLTKAEGVIKLNTNNIVQLPYIDASDTMEIFIDQYGNLDTFTLNAAYNVYWYKIIVEYTKTTD